MNNRSAVWLISVLCAFAILMTVLFSIIGCQNEDNETDSGTHAVEVDATPEETSSSDAAESEYFPNTDSDDSTAHPNTESGILDGSDSSPDSTSATETEMPETELTSPELASVKIKGNYTPSDARVDELYAAILDYGRPVGFTAVDINTGMSISYNADKKFTPASIIKASVVYYACTQIDAGKASLDEKLTYTSADVVHGNGVIGKAGVGSVFTLREVIYHTVNTSDNEGYYMLLRRFGRSGHDDLVRSLGCSSGLVSSSRWPRVTAEDFARVWQAIYNYRNESTTGKWLYELFLNVDQMHFFRNALSVETANKAGWNSSNYNDSGIIYGDRTYVLVLLTDGSYYNAEDAEFNAIVKAVNAMMSEYALTAEPMPETERFLDDLPEPLPYEPPVVTEPVDTSPVDTAPIDTTPVDTEPVVTDPPAADTAPADSDPITTDTDPVVTDPAVTEPIPDTSPITDTTPGTDTESVTETDPVTDTVPIEDTDTVNT